MILILSPNIDPDGVRHLGERNDGVRIGTASDDLCRALTITWSTGRARGRQH